MNLVLAGPPHTSSSLISAVSSNTKSNDKIKTKGQFSSDCFDNFLISFYFFDILFSIFLFNWPIQIILYIFLSHRIKL